MKIAVVVALGMVAFLGWRVTELERRYYTLLVGVCEKDRSGPNFSKCVNDTQPRKSQWWNLYYGVVG